MFRYRFFSSVQSGICDTPASPQQSGDRLPNSREKSIHFPSKLTDDWAPTEQPTPNRKDVELFHKTPNKPPVKENSTQLITETAQTACTGFSAAFCPTRPTRNSKASAAKEEG